jgi:CPA2 family monovalent cation:H+ antiporter-2
MGDIPVLEELVIIVALGVVVALVLGRLRLPTITGLLVAGVVAGPHALSLVHNEHTIEALAEVGVVLLLFGIGLELSISRLTRIMRLLLLGGSIQVGVTFVAAGGIAIALGSTIAEGAVLGMVFALSSTAIVLRLLGERRELDAPHGRFIVGVLIFQDLCVVPMVLAIPLLASPGGDWVTEAGIALGKAFIAVVAVLIGARFLVPRLLSWVDASRSRELFVLAVLTIGIGTAWITSLAGLSLALGAFLGGVAIADTKFAHRALGDIIPLRDAFVSLFFISLGMLLDPEVFLTAPLEVALFFAGFALLKGAFATTAALAMRFPARVAWLAGVGLAQFGEFGFVILRLAEDHEILGANDAAIVMAAGISSMSVTPLLIRIAPHVTAGERLLAPLARLLTPGSIETHPEIEAKLRDHAIVIGYGVAGALTGRALTASGLPFVAIEMNAETVAAAQERGEPVYYGDATSPETLEHAAIDHAKVVAIMVNDPSAVPRVLAAIQLTGSKPLVIVRTHYLHSRESLMGKGAHEIIVEEVESGVEIVARALRGFGVPRNVIERRIAEARDATLASERPTRLSAPPIAAHFLSRLRVDSVVLEEPSPAIGKTITALDLRRKTGALAIAIERTGTLVPGQITDVTLQVGDVVHLAGAEPQIAQAVVFLSAEPSIPPAPPAE